MKQQSLKKNMTFQSVYQILLYLIPLFIAPYLTRVLQAEALGIYSYVNSIAFYFVIFVNLGISRHGQRVIASNRDDKEKCREVFWSLFTLHLIIGAVVSFLYFIFAFFIVKENNVVYFIQGLYVLSAVFDITWLFYGLENFKSVVIRNSIVKIIECLLIFLLVKTPGDLWVYTLIMSGSILLGQLIMLPQAVKELPPKRFPASKMKPHMVPMLILFISVIASTLYTVFDKTLVGLMLEITDVAFYEYANKIVNIPKCMLAVVGTVMFPRACKAAADGLIHVQKRYIDISLLLISILSTGCMFGLIAVSDKLVCLYFGEEFIPCSIILKSMAPLLLIILIGDIARSEYLIPAKKDKLYVTGIALAAVLNVILTILLIPVFGSLGAVIGTTSAELFNLIYELIASRKVIKASRLMKILIPFLLAGILLFAIVTILDINTPTTWTWLIIEVLTGILVYGGISVLLILLLFKEYKNDFFRFRKK